MSTQSTASLEDDNLPTWDLSDLYPSLDSDFITQDKENILRDVEKFSKTYRSGLEDQSITAGSLEKALDEYENILERVGKLGSFAGLSYYANLADPDVLKLYQEIQEFSTSIQSSLLFFTLRLNKFDDEKLNTLIKQSSTLQKYQSWFDSVRKYKPYELDEKLEQLLSKKSLTGAKAWVRLYDETLSSSVFDYKGEKVNISTIMDLQSDKDRKVREAAAQSLSKGLDKDLKLYTFITNTLAKDKNIEDTWRQYPSSQESRHLANDIESDVVESLFESVKSAYPKLSHRYYALKAQLLGLEKLDYFDRNAPLLDATDRHISWPQAQRIVFEAYNNFSPEMAKIGERFYKNDWIDVGVRNNKTSGAFAHPTVPSAHPYLLLNFQGKLRDVSTFAHELGHGIHQVLAAEQGYLLSQTPLTLAETASVFGEMLTFQSLLKQAHSDSEKRYLLASKIDDMMNTVVRQIAFYDFEKQVHEMRKSRELTSNDLADIWLKTQGEALGPSVHINDYTCSYWAYISHFIHAPFYVYAYAFGDCLVNSLYGYFQKNPDGFQEKYMDMLRAGGTKHHSDLLKPFGLNAADKSFWQKGLSLIESMINSLEKLMNK